MNKSLILFIILLLSISCCYKIPEEIPDGEWNYRLLVNGVEAGRAVVSNRIIDGNHVSSTGFEIKIGNITTISKEKVIETMDFRPLRLESLTKIDTGSSVHKTHIKAIFRGREVELSSDNTKATYKINKDFILDGNYFMSRLIEGKFKEGLEITNYIYHPSIEMEEPVLVKSKVVGFENVNTNGKSERLIHIVQSIENIKTIDQYIDEHGIMKKVVIQMLNMRIELVKE